MNEIITNVPAVIFYGDRAMAATVTEIKYTSDKAVRLVGLTPAGTGHVAWFAPAPDGFPRLESVGGSTVAYV